MTLTSRGSKTAGSSHNPLNEHIIVLKEEMVMSLYGRLIAHLCTVCRDHSWSVRVCIKIA